jgi:hypothetical protein
MSSDSPEEVEPGSADELRQDSGGEVKNSSDSIVDRWIIDHRKCGSIKIRQDV